MSKWEDTVMDKVIIGERAKNISGAPYSSIAENLEWLLQHQAEISFNLRTEDILKQLRGFNQRGLTITEALDLLQ